MASKKNKVCLLLGALIGLFIAGGIFIPFVGSEQASLTSTSNDQITVVNDRDAFDALYGMLQSAQKSIHMSQFELKYYTSQQYKDSHPNYIVQALIDAHKRGIEVKIVVDEYGNKYNDDLTKVILMLKKEGVNIKLDNPKTTTHTKLTIVDGEWVMVGSTNMSHYAFDKNHEANVVIRSKTVASDFEQYFNKIWAES